MPHQHGLGNYGTKVIMPNRNGFANLPEWMHVVRRLAGYP